MRAQLCEEGHSSICDDVAEPLEKSSRSFFHGLSRIWSRAKKLNQAPHLTASTLSTLSTYPLLTPITTLKTYPSDKMAASMNARDDAEIAAAEAQALRWLADGHDFILETWKVFLLEKDTTGKPSMLQSDLEALEKAHHATGHGANDVEWAYDVLCSTRTEEAATPAVMIFLRTCPTGPGAVWKIPEEIHSRDLLPYCDDLAKRAAISWARGKLFDEWDEREKAAEAAAALKAQADALSAAALAKMQEENRAALAAWEATPERQEYLRMMESQRLPLEPEVDAQAAKKEASANSAQREAQIIFMKITGRPGMAEVAGWHAHDAVSRHGMSVGQAIKAAVKHLSMWTWATPEAKAKREAARASQQLVDKRWLAIYGATED